MNRVLLVSQTTGYQLRAFNDAAGELGVELVFATDRCHRLDDPWRDRAVAVRFHEPDASIAAIVTRAGAEPIAGVIAVGDRPVPLAARAAAALGITWHSVAGADASTDKRHSRSTLAAAGLPAPHFGVLAVNSPRRRVRLSPPWVLKAVGLSGSRGVIRANNAREFDAAFERIRTLLERPDIRAARTGVEDEILVEQYIEGAEYALEGVMTGGALQTFAIFDKPDPLTGPFFEETIYAAPSALPPRVQGRLIDQVTRAAAALGLAHGPIHAECRITPAGEVYVLEVAARPIGGLCSRVLTFDDDHAAGVSLEWVLLRHALGADVSSVARERRGAAVMMIPIPRRGLLRRVTGIAAAERVSGITEVHITAKLGHMIEPLPEGGTYLGFIFARGESAETAVAAVREAHRRLVFSITPELPVSAG